MALLANVSGSISKHLRNDPTVNAHTGTAVYTVLPNEPKNFPMILVARTGGGPVFTDPLMLDEVRLQVDVWADRQAEANTVAEAVRSSLASLQGTVFDGAAFVMVDLINYTESPDTSLTPTKQRVILEVLLRVRV